MRCSGAVAHRAKFPSYRYPQRNEPGRTSFEVSAIQRLQEGISTKMTFLINLSNLLLFLQRILVATNLFGRGMDIERVNIVFNYDMPEDSDTYLHRVARAGRFGTKGLAITFVSEESDAKILNEVQDRFDVNITELPDEIDLSSYSEYKNFIFAYKVLMLTDLSFFS